MREAFVDYLVHNQFVSAASCEQLRSLLRGASEPIGAIAFKYGIVTGDDIDCILEEQRKQHRPFGEIAIEKGILTRSQLRDILEVQQLRAAAETAEALVLSGSYPAAEMITHLGEFFCRVKPAQPAMAVLSV